MTSLRSPARPLSPHLQIWRWTPVMAASITHRATGIALYAGTVLLSVWTFAAALGADAFRPVGAILASPLGLALLAGYAWALLFHAFNGVRHLYWDQGRGLDLKSVKATALAAFGASLALAGVIVGAALMNRAG
ncbi:MAG: succinate dehydrogenase, cytochrome b556 subunit [Parvularculaceae bacterium]|nr:succinate dehydrogenase, cytochrome b556 subunit [Parvularculaceae bacterium]